MPSQQDYHRELAASLMVSIGYEDAVEWALANQWQGVLEQLQTIPRQDSAGKTLKQ
jgi:hypothetical protein